jgi:hypothetical protein
MPAFHTFDLHAGLTRGGISLEAYVKNIGNAYGMTRLLSEVNAGYGPPYSAAIIPPRTFGLSISDTF